MKTPRSPSPPSSSSSSSSSAFPLRKARGLSPFLFTLLAFIVFVVTLYGEDFMCLLGQLDPYSSQDDVVAGNTSPRRKWEVEPAFAVGKKPAGCDYFSGRWVWDETAGPLYEESECPYIQPQLTCQAHGRPDRDYQFWRWQPHGCDLPSFNATLMLESLRGKRMMYVGDSLNRGQYVSMVCLVHRLIPNESAKSMETTGSLTVFTAADYNATIEFYWAPFLLESNSDDAVIHRGSFDDEAKEIVEVSTEDAYRMAMRSMMRWARKNMDPRRTRVFFTSMSPTHAKSGDWGGEPGKNCYNETTPINNATYWGSDSRRSIMQVIGEEFGKSKYPVTFLNITQLSNYRKDAHTSIYKKQWSPLTAEQLANPVSYADCTHWCLPGLQDTWNELLFAKLFYP
ncbi:unnamed protein product [Linum tenue]|uniref:Trichome birefringence-like N-terminal domain-containing protein n=1 Tax=Linum tenue TaxID=586396 RepID=A0AAV0K453_9ROSI|nr:unnamed protein product [Linum tenue]